MHCGFLIVMGSFLVPKQYISLKIKWLKGHLGILSVYFIDKDKCVETGLFPLINTLTL